MKIIGRATLVLVFALQSSAARTAQTPTLPQPAVAVLAFFDGINRGDAAAAADAFAENGIFIGAAAQGLCSLQAPCFGRDKIREDMEVLFKSPHLCETVTAIQVNGTIVTGRVEARNDNLRASGVEHVALAFMAQVLENKIAVDLHRADLADSETAKNAAILAGKQPKGTPITVVPPCRTYAPAS